MNKAVFFMALLLLVGIVAAVYAVVSTYHQIPGYVTLNSTNTSPPPKITSPVLNNILNVQKPPQTEPTSSFKAIDLSKIPLLPDFFTWKPSSSKNISDAISYDNIQSEKDVSKQYQKSFALRGTLWTGSRTFSCDEDFNSVVGDFLDYYNSSLSKENGWEPNHIYVNGFGFHPLQSDYENGSEIGYIASDQKNIREIIVSYKAEPFNDCPSKLTLSVFVSDEVPINTILGIN